MPEWRIANDIEGPLDRITLPEEMEDVIGPLRRRLAFILCDMEEADSLIIRFRIEEDPTLSIKFEGDPLAVNALQDRLRDGGDVGRQLS